MFSVNFFSVTFFFDFPFVNFLLFFWPPSSVAFRDTSASHFFFLFSSVRGSRWLAIFRKRPFFPTPVCGFPLPSVTNFLFPVFSPVVTTTFVMGYDFLFTLSLTFLCKKVLLGLLGMQTRAFTSKSSIVRKVVLTPQFVLH